MAKTLICSNCNAPLPYPEGGFLIQCEFCGATCDLRSTKPPPLKPEKPAPTAAEPPSALSKQALHARIKDNPFDIEAYKALRRLYSEKSQYDEAWCLCSALSFLGQADDEEEQLYAQRRPRSFVRASARTTDELWSRWLLHPDEDRQVCAIFALVTPYMASATARRHKDFKLKRKKRRDLSADKSPFTEIFSYAVSILNLVTPDLFAHKEYSGLRMAHTEQAPSFLVGPDLEGQSKRQLAFVVGKQLSYLRPEHFLRRILAAPSEANAALSAALSLGTPKFAIPPGDADAAKMRKQLSGEMPSGTLDQLATAAHKYVEAGSQADVTKWWNAVELSANRVGFVLCNDLALAAKMVEGPAEVGALPPKERVKDLVAFCVSEEYFRVREQLGLSS